MIKKSQKKYIFYGLIIVLTIITIVGLIALYKKGKESVSEYVSKRIQSELVKVEKNTRLEWEKLSISFIPLKVEMKKVKINIPNNKMFPKSLTIDSLVVTPDYMAFINRRLSAKITFIGSNITIKAKANKKINRNKQLSLNLLKKVPISNLSFKNTTLSFTNDINTISVEQLNTKIHLSASKIAIKADTPSMEIGSQPIFSSSINITIKKDIVYLNYFKVENKNSWLTISSDVEGKIELQKIQSGKIKIIGSFLSEDLTTIIQVIKPQFKNPLKGRIIVNSELKYSKPSKLSGYIDLSAKQMSIANIFLSTVQVKGYIKNHFIHFEKFLIREPNQWHIDLKKSKINLKSPYHFQAKVAIKNSQLNTIFNTLNLKNIPLTSIINGKWECNGTLYQNKDIECRGDTRFNQFIVHGGKNQTILNISQLKTNTHLNFINKILTAKTKVQSGSDSLIDIDSMLNQEGLFTSKYKGVVHLSDIKNLVSLDPKGLMNIVDGTISVNNNKLNIESNLHLQDFTLSKFHMGNVKTYFNYTNKGILHFRKIRGQVKQSKYKGNLSINIFKNTIQAFAHSSRITLENIKYILKDRIYFPFEITGTGTFSGYLNGPLKINIMSYNLHAQFFKIKWERESFNKAFIHVESKKGYVKTRQVNLIKNNGQIIFQGQVDPKGNMNAQLIGRDLYLQESANIAKVTNSEIAGIADFDMNLNGYFLNPLSKTNVKIKDLFYKGYPVGDSTLTLQLRKHQLEVAGSVASNLTIQKLIYPYKKEGIVEIQAMTKNLNIRELFLSNDSATQLYNQFQSNINSMIDISYKKNQLLQSLTGNIKVDKITIDANSYTLSSKWPFSVNFKNGTIQTEPILLQSGGQSLHIIQSEKEYIHISGDIKLDFFIFIFPFMRIWEGDLVMNLHLNSQLIHWSPKGQVNLKNGFVQITPQIDPFEEIYSDIELKNNNIIFHSLHTKTGGGNLQAKGNIDFLNTEYTPINIKGTFSQVQLGSLPGIYAKGSGQISLTGKKTPYTLGITSTVKEAKIEKEFISNQANQIQANPRLSLLEEDRKNVNPIQMNFDLHFKNPIQIENSTIKSSFVGKTRITGYPPNLLLSGTLKSLPEGTITFRDHEFDILSAKISYFNNKPNNPVINLRARTFVREAQNNPNKFSNNTTFPNDDFQSNTNFSNEYNILLRVKGRGKKPIFTLTSTPSMSENEIVSLLAFGARSITFKPGNTINNIAKYSYYHLGPVLFQKAIGRELKDTLGVVDQFLIVPHISTKNNSTVTKLIIRKKLFNRLNLSGSRTILDQNPTTDLKAEYKINKNISIIGLLENETPIEGSDKENNTIGLDLEYQIDF